MLQVFHEAHVADLETDTPGAGIAGVVVVEPPAQVAVTHEGGEVAHGSDGGHTLGAVLHVAVVTGGIPAEHAGHAPIHLVFHQSLGQPAFTLQLGAAHIGGVPTLDDVGTAITFHVAVVDVEFDVQRIPQGDGHRQTGPEHGAVEIAAGVVVVKEAVRGNVKPGKIRVHGHPGVTIVVHTTVDGIPSIAAGHAVHDPRGGLHAVELQIEHEGEQIHVVQIVGMIVLASTMPAINVRVVIVVIERTGPQGGQGNVFVEGVGGGHAGHVGIHHRGAAGLVGQGHALKTHAELQVGVGHKPIQVGALDLDDVVAVSAQSAALIITTPVLVADFKIQRTGQGFGSHGIQLHADTLNGGEVVAVVGLPIILLGGQVGVGGGKAEQPLALGLEINGAGAGGGTEQHARGQSESHKLLHDLPSLTFGFCDYGLAAYPCGSPILRSLQMTNEKPLSRPKVPTLASRCTRPLSAPRV